MTQWEYKIVRFGAVDIVNAQAGRINREGYDGWELVSAVGEIVGAPSGCGCHVLYFKRPV